MANQDVIQAFKEKLATASPDLKAEYEAIKSQLSPLPEEEQVEKLVEDPQLRECYNAIIEKLIGKAELSDDELGNVAGGRLIDLLYRGTKSKAMDLFDRGSAKPVKTDLFNRSAGDPTKPKTNFV